MMAVLAEQSVPGMQVLRSGWVSRMNQKSVYCNPSLATEDALRIGRLHTDVPGGPRSASCQFSPLQLISAGQ